MASGTSRPDSDTGDESDDRNAEQILRQDEFAGECKFTSRPVSEGVPADLEQAALEVRWSEAPADGNPLYVLFSRPVYTGEFRRDADAPEDLHLYETTDLVTADSDS